MSTPPLYLVHPTISPSIPIPQYFTPPNSSSKSDDESPLLTASAERALYALLDSPESEAGPQPGDNRIIPQVPSDPQPGAKGIFPEVQGSSGFVSVSGGCSCPECTPPRPQTSQPQSILTPGRSFPIPREFLPRPFFSPPQTQRPVQSWQYPCPPPVQITSFLRAPGLTTPNRAPFSPLGAPFYPVAPTSALPSGCSPYCLTECHCVHVHHFHPLV